MGQFDLYTVPNPTRGSFSGFLADLVKDKTPKELFNGRLQALAPLPLIISAWMITDCAMDSQCIRMRIPRVGIERRNQSEYVEIDFRPQLKIALDRKPSGWRYVFVVITRLWQLHSIGPFQQFFDLNVLFHLIILFKVIVGDS